MKKSQTFRSLVVGGIATSIAGLVAASLLRAEEQPTVKARSLAVPVLALPDTAPASPTAPASVPASGSAPAPASVPSVTAALNARREAKVHAVAFSGTPGTENVAGVTNSVTVRVEPNKTGKPLVGISEEFVSGTGSEWRAAAWMAAFNATHALNIPITDVEVLFMLEGKIDGPSAGLLMTATLAALLTDTPILPNTTMTGAINPDGTSGPVGGIPQKIEGAAKDGFKRFGYPLGQRQDTDLRTMDNVDIVATAKKHGMEAVELKDLWSAYKFLTGKELPHPEAVSESDMELDASVQDQVKSRVKALIGQIEQQGLLFKKRARAAVEAGSTDEYFETWGISRSMDNAVKFLGEAIRMRDAGEYAGAWERLMEASACQTYANLLLDFLTPFLKNDWEGMSDALQAASGAARTKLDAALDDLKSRCKKETVGGRMSAATGVTNFVQAYIFQDLADNALPAAYSLLKKFDKEELKADDLEARGALLNSVFSPLWQCAVAQVMAQGSEDAQRLTLDEGGGADAPSGSSANIGRGYAAAAGATLAGIETLVIGSRARTRDDGNVSAARAEVEAEDSNFPVVELATRIAEHSEKLFKGDADATGIFQLGFGGWAYIGGGSMINRYYSLGGRMNADGEIKIERKRSLSYQLEAAKQRALEAAGRARHTLGFIPGAARASFQMGLSLREGTDIEKLQALETFWWSTFWSNAAVQMAAAR